MQYIDNPICKKHLNYYVAFAFFLTFNLFGYFFIIYNVFNFDYGETERTVKLLFSIVWIFFSVFLSRFFCILKEDEIREKDNFLEYDTF